MVYECDIKLLFGSRYKLYRILHAWKFYMLPYGACTLKFLRALFRGDKKLLKLKDLKPVSEACYPAFNVRELYQLAMSDCLTRKFFPEPNGQLDGSQTIDRIFLL